MAVLRLTSSAHEQVRRHLFSQPGEHFAFLLCDVPRHTVDPLFLVRDTLLVPDHQVIISPAGWELTDEMLDRVVNTAVRTGKVLVECHTHGGPNPRFSPTDRAGIGPLARFLADVLQGRPYGATVWGDRTVYGEAHSQTESGELEIIPFRSITALGSHLRQLVSADDLDPVEALFDRQLAWFGELGQRQLGRLRVAVTGCGGTGSHVCQQLAYLGVRNFVLVDPDGCETTNLNRTVTTIPAMVGMSKVWAAAQAVRSIAPAAAVHVLHDDLRRQRSLDTLKTVDVLIGCVDNDGARLVLNRLALAYEIPYLDVATDLVPGTHAADVFEAIGGRVAAVLPEGPCLSCMGEIDRTEAAYHLASPWEQAEARRRGYADGILGQSPSVVFLNGVAASLLINEFAALVSSIRPVQPFTDIDLLGSAHALPGNWVAPRRVELEKGCFECLARGKGDAAELEALSLKDPVA